MPAGSGPQRARPGINAKAPLTLNGWLRDGQRVLADLMARGRLKDVSTRPRRFALRSAYSRILVPAWSSGRG
jgi:hypothetical protein